MSDRTVDFRCSHPICAHKGTYRLRTHCGTCGYDFISLHTKTERPSYNRQCPQCGVDNLQFGTSPDIGPGEAT